MSLFFSNPWGLLALAGIPAVIALHFLRRKSRPVVATGFFLLPPMPKSREGGRRWKIPRQTAALWVQLAAVAILALLLAGPRWVDPRSRLAVVVVLDSSASMESFRKEALEALTSLLSQAGQAAGTVHWTALDSRGEKLASGADGDNAAEAVGATWRTLFPAHDPAKALEIARRIAGPDGTAAFLSDRPPESAESPVWHIACGKPTANAAVLGGHIEGNTWSATLANFSPREESIAWNQDNKPAKSLVLGPGETGQISGQLDPGTDHAEVTLEADALSADNRLPLIRPREKRMTVGIDPRGGEIFQRMAAIAGFANEQGDKADLQIVAYDPLAPAMPARDAVVAVSDPSPSKKAVPGGVVAENDPLIENLDWSALMAADSLGVPFREGDRGLLWAGGRPLIFLREGSDGRQLVFNFDLAASNAPRLPAFPILLHRFFESVRGGLEKPWAANVATGQSVPVAGSPGGFVVAPDQSGFFHAPGPDGAVLFEGAATFSDPNESDLRAASSGEWGRPDLTALRGRNATGSNWDVLLLAVLAGLIGTNWWLTGSAGVPPERP